MTDELSFVEEIRRSPHDLTPRLIYADYLEDCGNPRGELIRVQCQLDELQAGAPGRADLFKQERDLLERYGNDWLAPLRAMGVQGVSIHSFQRGLLEHVRMDVADFVKHGHDLCQTAPALCRLQLRNLTETGLLDELKIPAAMTHLDLSANKMTVDWWHQHGVQLQGAGVTDVDLRANQLGDPQSLISLTQVWPNLKSLCLGDNRFRRLSPCLLYTSPSPRD